MHAAGARLNTHPPPLLPHHAGAPPLCAAARMRQARRPASHMDRRRRHGPQVSARTHTALCLPAACAARCSPLPPALLLPCLPACTHGRALAAARTCCRVPLSDAARPRAARPRTRTYLRAGGSLAWAYRRCATCLRRSLARPRPPTTPAGCAASSQSRQTACTGSAAPPSCARATRARPSGTLAATWCCRWVATTSAAARATATTTRRASTRSTTRRPGRCARALLLAATLQQPCAARMLMRTRASALRGTHYYALVPATAAARCAPACTGGRLHGAPHAKALCSVGRVVRHGRQLGGAAAHRLAT